MSAELKLHATVRVRVSRLLKKQLHDWATRAGLSYSDFVRMAIVMGARRYAIECGLYREADDRNIEDLPPHNFRGSGDMGAAPKRPYPPHSGELPTDEEVEALQARREALAVK